MAKQTGIITFNPPAGTNPSETIDFFYFKPERGGDKIPFRKKRWFHLYISRIVDNKEDFSKISIFGDFIKQVDGWFLFKVRDGVSRASLASHEKRVTRSSFNSHARKVIRTDLKKLQDWERSKPHDPTDSELSVEIYWHESKTKCNCKYESIEEYASVKLIGTIYVIYSFNLFSYLHKDSKNDAHELFVEYRGQDSKNSILAKLDLKETSIKLDGGKRGSLIDITDREESMIDDGDKFSVFRGRLRRRWLVAKTYKLNVTDSVSYNIRLSRTGLIEVRKEKTLNGKEGDRLEKVYKGLLRHRTISQLPPASTEEKQLEEVTNIVKEFAEAAVNNINELIEKESSQRVKLKKGEVLEQGGSEDGDSASKYRTSRQKYVVIFLSGVTCGKSCNNYLTASGIQKGAPELILGILQGSLVFDEVSPQLSVPKIPRPTDSEINDLSTWCEELCVFSSERALIYFEPKTVLEAPQSVVNYEDYWKCVVRGVEHTISVRTALQLVERDTHDFISRLPPLMKGIVAYKANEKRKAKAEDYNRIRETILSLAEDLAHSIEILPKLRDVCVPTSIFRSGHTVVKFTFLNETCFQFTRILSNIQQNVNELTDFLMFFKQQQLQMALDLETKAKEKRDRILEYLVLIFTIAASYFIFPTFFHDFTKFLLEECNDNLHECFQKHEEARFAAGLYLLPIILLFGMAIGIILWGRRAKA